MSVPDADTLIRLAEILEVSVSELLGTKIENENVARSFLTVSYIFMNTPTSP